MKVKLGSGFFRISFCRTDRRTGSRTDSRTDGRTDSLTDRRTDRRAELQLGAIGARLVFLHSPRSNRSNILQVALLRINIQSFVNWVFPAFWILATLRG